MRTPSCSAEIGHIVHLPGGRRYAVELRSRIPGTLDALLTLYTTTKSFTLDLHDVALAAAADGASPEFSSAIVFFRLGSAEPLQAAEMHVVRIGEFSKCGNDEFVVSPDAVATDGPWSGRSLSARALQRDEPTLESAFRQDEAPLACAEPYHPARLVHGVSPVYPAAARSGGVSGTTFVKVSLGSDGSVTSATIYRSSGTDSLDDAALDSANASTYAPEVFRCVPHAGTYLFTVVFGR